MHNNWKKVCKESNNSIIIMQYTIAVLKQKTTVFMTITLIKHI